MLRVVVGLGCNLDPTCHVWLFPFILKIRGVARRMEDKIPTNVETTDNISAFLEFENGGRN